MMTPVFESGIRNTYIPQENPYLIRSDSQWGEARSGGGSGKRRDGRD